jgi:hypothetical protein
MKARILIVLSIIALTFLAVSLTYAATVTSQANGLWSDIATWNTGALPTSLDSVVIRATDSVAVFTGPYTCKSLTVLGKLVDTVAAASAGGQGDLTITNVLTLAAGSSFYLGQKLNTLPAAAIKNIDNASTIVIYGTQGSVTESPVGNLYIRTSSGGIGFAVNMIINGNLTCKMSSSSNAIKGTSATSGSLTHTVMGNVYIYAGIFAAVDVGTDSTIGIWNIKGNVLMSGASSGIARMGPFSSASSRGTGIFNIDGNLTIDNGGRLQAGNSSTAGTGVGIFNLKGNLTLTSTGTINTNNGIGAFAINFIGSGVQTVIDSMASGISNLNTFYDTVAVGSTVVFANPAMTWGQGSASTNPAGTFVVLGTLKLGTSQITGLQNVDVKSGATLFTGHAFGLDSAITVTGKTFSTSANYGYNGSVAQVTGTVLPATVHNLTIDNASGVALSQATTVNNQLRLTAGVLDNSVNSVTLGPGGSVVFSGGSLAVPIGIELSLSSIDFGTVTAGQNKIDTITVTNHATSAVNITSITSTNAVFTVTPTSVSVGAESTQKFIVTFTPTVNGPQTGKIVFAHNTISVSDTVTVTGTGTGGAGVENVEAAIPKVYQLYNNYPNPFNPSTTIQYDIPRQSKVVLKVYSLLGQEIATLVDGVVESGYHQTVWNGQHVSGSQVASGVYLFRMSAQSTSGKSEAFTQMKKMLLVK